jgi:hypothetical protein
VWCSIYIRGLIESPSGGLRGDDAYLEARAAAVAERAAAKVEETAATEAAAEAGRVEEATEEAVETEGAAAAAEVLPWVFISTCHLFSPSLVSHQVVSERVSETRAHTVAKNG